MTEKIDKAILKESFDTFNKGLIVVNDLMLILTPIVTKFMVGDLVHITILDKLLVDIDDHREVLCDSGFEDLVSDLADLIRALKMELM